MGLRRLAVIQVPYRYEVTVTFGLFSSMRYRQQLLVVGRWGTGWDAASKGVLCIEVKSLHKHGLYMVGYTEMRV